MSKTLILTGIIIIIIYAAEMLGFGQFIHAQKWIILSFFVAISFLFHTLVALGFANNREQFVQFYLASVVFRLLLSMIFLTVALLMHVQQRELFVINFIVLYLCYTIFEISNLSRKLRHN